MSLTYVALCSYPLVFSPYVFSAYDFGTKPSPFISLGLEHGNDERPDTAESFA